MDRCAAVWHARRFLPAAAAAALCPLPRVAPAHARAHPTTTDHAAAQANQRGARTGLQAQEGGGGGAQGARQDPRHGGAPAQGHRAREGACGAWAVAWEARGSSSDSIERRRRQAHAPAGTNAPVSPSLLPPAPLSNPRVVTRVRAPATGAHRGRVQGRAGGAGRRAAPGADSRDCGLLHAHRHHPPLCWLYCCRPCHPRPTHSSPEILRCAPFCLRPPHAAKPRCSRWAPLWPSCKRSATPRATTRPSSASAARRQSCARRSARRRPARPSVARPRARRWRCRGSSSSSSSSSQQRSAE